MKILMISCGFPPDVNAGAEKFCYTLSKKLIQNGLNVEVATDTQFEEWGGIKLHKLFIFKNKHRRKLYFDYYNYLNVITIKKIIETVEPDIIHFHNLYGVGSNLVHYTGMDHKTLLTVHDIWLTKYSDKISFFDEIHKRILLRHLRNTILVSPSHFLAKRLNATGYSNIEIIKNGIELPLVKKNMVDKTPKILYVGRLTKDKGIKFITDIFSSKKMDITVVGDGPLLSYVKNKIHINAKGFKKDTQEYYLDHDVLIVPSLIEENQPTVILEAFSYGLPVVASDIGGIPEMVDHGKTGLLFKPGDEIDFEKQLRYLLDNPQKIKDFGQNAIEKVENDFNWDKTVRNYLELYNRLMNR